MDRLLLPNNWRRECFPNAPLVSIYPTADCSTLYSGDLCPLSNGANSPIKRNHAATTPIAGLLLFSGPSTIAFRVSQTVVNTINTMVRRWPWSHILKKVLETIASAPPLTNRNPPSSVVSKRTIPWVTTPPVNMLPRAMLRGIRQAVRSPKFAYPVFSKAPTTGGHAVAQRPSKDHFSSPTLTFDVPPRLCLRTVVFRSLYYQEATKCSPSQVY